MWPPSPQWRVPGLPCRSRSRRPGPWAPVRTSAKLKFEGCLVLAPRMPRLRDPRGMVQTSVSSTNGSDLESSESRFHCSNLGRRLVDKKKQEPYRSGIFIVYQVTHRPYKWPYKCPTPPRRRSEFLPVGSWLPAWSFRSFQGFGLLRGQKRERSSGFRDLLLGAESWL